MQEVGGVEDAAATTGNLGIGEALDFVHELPLAAAGIHQMGVGVAPTWQDGAPMSIDDVMGIRLPDVEVGHPAKTADTVTVDG